MKDFVMMDERKLLKKAVELGRMRSSKMTPEVVAVALGWLRGEVRMKEAKIVLGCNNAAGGYQRIALVLREAWREGLLRYEPPSYVPKAEREYLVEEGS